MNINKLVDDISNNKIDNLTFISNTENFIKEENVKKITDAIKKSKVLKTLYLNSVGLQTYPNILNMYLQSFAESPSVLYEITLYNCHITDECGSQLMSIVGPTLDNFKVSGNNLSVKFSEAFSSRISQFNNCMIRMLYLDSNNIGNEGASFLASAIKHLLHLTILSLNHCEIGDDGINSIVSSLKETSWIESLSLQQNKITHVGVKSIVTLFNVSKLKSLYLSENNIGDEGAVYIASCKDALKYQTTLNLNICSIGPKGLKEIFQNLIQNCSNIFNVQIGENTIDVEASIALGKALMENSSMMYLDLRNMHLTSEMLGPIFEGLSHNFNCTRITLDNNILDEKSMGIISDTLLKLECKDIVISMNFCGINDTSIVPLLPSIIGNSPLTDINVRGNKIGPKGMAMLFQALKRNTRVTKLELDNNNFSKLGTDAMIDCLYENSTIKTFYSYISNIPAEKEKLIKEMVSNNSKGIKNVPPPDRVVVNVELPFAVPEPKPSENKSPIPILDEKFKENLLSKLDKFKELLEEQGNELKDLKEKISKLEDENKEQGNDILNLKEKINKLEDENKELRNSVGQQPSFGFGGPSFNTFEYIQ